MNNNNAQSVGLRAVYTRGLGAVLMFKASIPVLVVFFLFMGAWVIANSVNQNLNQMNQKIEPKIKQAQEEIANIRQEGQRLVNEVKKVENKTTEVVGDIKESVEPIRKSLLGLSSALRTTSGTIESLLNAMIKVINRLPGIKIKKVNLPNIQMPGLKLPDINMDLNLKPDLTAVKNFQKLSEDVANHADAALDEITQTFTHWWWTMKVVINLILIWLFLTLVGFSARAWHSFHVGWKLFKGEQIDGALLLL